MLHNEICKNHIASECLCLPMRFTYDGHLLFHVFGIEWIFVSREIFKKAIIFKCFCFPILFSYYENSLFPFFGNCVDFCFTQMCKKDLTLECSVFPYFSRAIGIHFIRVSGIILLM